LPLFFAKEIQFKKAWSQVSQAHRQGGTRRPRQSFPSKILQKTNEAPAMLGKGFLLPSGLGPYWVAKILGRYWGMFFKLNFWKSEGYNR
jgi:hypothetical protein